jgi:cytosine/adenosine deaminase-related metal-dependent hydrolase
MEPKMLVTNGKLITWGEPNQVLEGQALYLQNGLIAAIGPQAELLARYPQAEQLDAQGQCVLPGNICAHTHFYGAFARGMAIPGAPPKDFPEILQKLWWPLTWHWMKRQCATRRWSAWWTRSGTARPR